MNTLPKKTIQIKAINAGTNHPPIANPNLSVHNAINVAKINQIMSVGARAKACGSPMLAVAGCSRCVCPFKIR
jgi:hypothetical protein